MFCTDTHFFFQHSLRLGAESLQTICPAFLSFYLYLYSKYDWTWNPYRIFLWDYSYKNARRFHNFSRAFSFYVIS